MTPSPPQPVTEPGARTVQVLRTALALTLSVLALGACTLVNRPSDEPAPPAQLPEAERPEAVAREFGGQFSVQGSTFPVVLSLVIRGEEVEEALLTVPELSMEARGEGYLREDRLVLELEYGDECEGDVRIAGDVASGGYVFEGTLTARDCTGAEEGALLLRRRSGDESTDHTRLRHR